MNWEGNTIVFFLEGQSIATKYAGQDCLPTNPEPVECKAGVITTAL
jgi:hypothetical protein